MSSIFHWLIVLSFVYLVYKLTRFNKVTNDKILPVNLEDVYGWPRLDEFDFNIVGESNYQSAIKKLASTYDFEKEVKEFDAIITLEDTNQYDNKAVRVDIDGQLVGYFSRGDARSFRRRLTTKKLGSIATKTKAVITGGHTDKNGNALSYGIVLDIKPFD